MMGRNLVSQSWALKFLQPNPNAAPPFLQLAGLRTAQSTCLIAFIHHCRLLARQPWSLPQHQCLCFFFTNHSRYQRFNWWWIGNERIDFINRQYGVGQIHTIKSLFYWSTTIGRTGCRQQDWKCPSHTIQGWDMSFFSHKNWGCCWIGHLQLWFVFW